MSYPPQEPYQPPVVPGSPQSPAPAPDPYPPAHQQQPIYAQPIVVTTPQLPASGAATASMVLGIVGLTLGWCLLGIPCILAVIFGHMALSDMKTRAMSGHGQAVAGLVMGYIGVAPAAFISIAWIIGSVTPQ